MIRIGFFQFAPRFGRVDDNLDRVTAALGKVRADIMVLPELAFTGYLFKDRNELASLAQDPAESPVVARLTALCRDRDLCLVTGFAEKSADKLFNSALVITKAGIVHTYRKLHLFNTEKACFDPGDLPLGTVTWRGIRIGAMVCFDWAFPEVARVLALKGADVLCHPANLVLAHCQQAMITRSVENAVYTVTANRIGSDTRNGTTLAFTGRSQIVTPAGERIYQAGADREALFVAKIDPGLARDKAITEKNDLFRDRRPECYGEIVSPLGKPVA